MTAPTTIAHLLDVVARDPGRPRLTWYGDDGERVELSAAVLANWVAKTTNLLVEEFDASPGTRVALDLPAHWRTVTWALAAWRCGAEVVLGDPTGPADVVVTDRPQRHDGAAELVAVGLPALARAFDGALPAGAIDGTAAVMTYGDEIGWAPDPVPGARALTAGPTVSVPHAALLEWAARERPRAAHARVLVPVGPDRERDTATLLAGVLGALAVDGSVVVVSASVAAELGSDTARRDRLVASERITDL